MKIERMTEIETNDIQIGDRIHVGKYTATCQEIMPKGALFLFDQYIIRSGELKGVLQNEEVLNIFKDIREHMVPFDNGDLLKAPFGYGWSTCDRIRFRPVFLISLKKEDTMTKDTTKKSAPENEETVRDVIGTFNETQRLVLYYLVDKAIFKEHLDPISAKYLGDKKSAKALSKALKLILNSFYGMEGEETIQDVLDTLNDKQRLVLNYLDKAAKDAKRRKDKDSVCN